MSEEQKSSQEKQAASDRIHLEGLGDQWVALVGNPAALMPQIVGTVLQAGGMRPSWRCQLAKEEYVLMAWPQEGTVRAAVLMHGQTDAPLKPLSAMPLLEGLPNDAMVDQVYPWEKNMGANVGLLMEEGRNPLWVYTPLYFRDREDLTPGVTHTFLIAGLAYGMRRALLDELTVTQGPQFEAYAEAWKEKNPDANPLDIPPLKIPLQGRRVIMPGRHFCEYQMRTTIDSVETTRLDKDEIYQLRVLFPFEKRPPLSLVLYAPKRVCGKYEPQQGDEIDAYVWLQGRIADYVVDDTEEDGGAQA